MKDNFDIHAWNKKRYLVEDIEEELNEELPSIPDLLAKNDENGEVPGSRPRPAKSTKNGVYVL